MGRPRNDGTIPRSNIDGPTWDAHPDVGCQYATQYLGYQSRCIDCPFPECLLEIRGEKVLQGIRRSNEDTTT